MRTRHHPRLLAGLLLAGVAPAAFAAGGYRSGQPEVLTPPARTAPDRLASLRALDEQLTPKNAPRIAIYWGRTLDPEPGVRYQHVREGTSQASVDANAHLDLRWHGADSNRHASADSSWRTVERDERVRADTSTPLESADDWALESRFGDRLAEAGVKLVDPKVSTRMAAREKFADARDVNGLEVRGLEKNADYIMEVRGRQDSEWEYRVTLTHVGTGQRMFDFTTSAKPPADPNEGRYVATRDGFVRQQRTLSVDDVADRLADEVAGRLLAVLSRE